MKTIHLFSFILISLNFSFCPTYPRMVMHFSHNKSQKETLDEIRILLKKEGFTVTKYAPEDGFMLTDYKVFNWGTGKRLLSVSVHVHDKVTINGMGKMDIPVSDIGDPEQLLNIKTFDRLPYRVQKKTFYTIIDPLEEIGIKQINHWP